MSRAVHACAACGYLVHASRFGSGATCPVCGWVDDFEQLVHPDLTYGANAGLSLRQAQTRPLPPVAGFVRDPRWRALRPGETPPPDPTGPSSPVCELAAPEPEDFVPYWRRAMRA